MRLFPGIADRMFLVVSLLWSGRSIIFDRMLYDPARHVPLEALPWSEDAALNCAREIFEFLCAGRQGDGLWPAHPDEDSSVPENKGLYIGAAGTLWALGELGRRLERPLPFDAVESAERIHEAYLKVPDSGSNVPSYFLGESAILRLRQKLAPSPDLRERIRACVAANTRNPVNEALWGSPGTMLLALQIGDLALYRENVDYLFEQWERESVWIWTQDLYGSKRRFLGAGHGFFGNIYPLLEGRAHLSTDQQELILQRTAETAIATATQEEDLVNWRPYLEIIERPSLLQWCHGAPGVITSLRSFPKGYSSELESLLVKGGEAIWAAGPLAKGIGICHGTDGNGFAFLRLFERTGDERWLERARKFAMHAMGKRNGRYTLWTGEAGFALYLLACIDGKADWPSLDYF